MLCFCVARDLGWCDFSPAIPCNNGFDELSLEKLRMVSSTLKGVFEVENLIKIVDWNESDL